MAVLTLQARSRQSVVKHDGQAAIIRGCYLGSAEPVERDMPVARQFGHAPARGL